MVQGSDIRQGSFSANLQKKKKNKLMIPNFQIIFRYKLLSNLNLHPTIIAAGCISVVGLQINDINFY